MGKRGPKPPELPANVVEEVERLAGLGMTRQQIHYFFRMGEEAWSTYEKRRPELVTAMAYGRSRQQAKVMGKLNEAIERGNLSAICFYLKTQCRWRETDRPGEEGGERAPLPVFVFRTLKDPVEASKIYQQMMRES